MSYNVPSSYPQEPVSGYVEQINQIEDGVHAATEANDIRDRISREIGHTAVQGWSGQN